MQYKLHLSKCKNGKFKNRTKHGEHFSHSRMTLPKMVWVVIVKLTWYILGDFLSKTITIHISLITREQPYFWQRDTVEILRAHSRNPPTLQRGNKHASWVRVNESVTTSYRRPMQYYEICIKFQLGEMQQKGGDAPSYHISHAIQ